MKRFANLKKGYFMVVFVLASFISHGQITIDSCQIKARKNFPLIKQFGLIEQTKEFNLSNANKAYLPQLDFTLIGGIIEGLPSFSPSESSSNTLDLKMISVIQLNQVIWDGGITRAKKKMISAGADAEKADIEVTLYALEDRINNLFFGILLINEQLKQNEILINTLERQLKRIENAYNNGTAYASDIDELKVQIITTQQKQNDLLFNKQGYLTILSAMIGEPIDPETTLVMPEPLFSTLSDTITRPEMALFESKKTMAEAQLMLNRAMLYPKIGIMGFGTFIQPGVDFGTSSISNILVAGISLNWSLGDLYKHANNKKLVALDLKKVNVQQETFLFNTNLEISQLKIELNKIKGLITQDEDLLAIKGRIKKAYDIKFENGTCALSELLDRINDESMTQQILTMHQVQYLMKNYQFQILVGKALND